MLMKVNWKYRNDLPKILSLHNLLALFLGECKNKLYIHSIYLLCRPVSFSWFLVHVDEADFYDGVVSGGFFCVCVDLRESYLSFSVHLILVSSYELAFRNDLTSELQLRDSVVSWCLTSQRAPAILTPTAPHFLYNSGDLPLCLQVDLPCETVHGSLISGVVVEGLHLAEILPDPYPKDHYKNLKSYQHIVMLTLCPLHFFSSLCPMIFVLALLRQAINIFFK